MSNIGKTLPGTVRTDVVIASAASSVLMNDFVEFKSVCGTLVVVVVSVVVEVMEIDNCW